MHFISYITEILSGNALKISFFAHRVVLLFYTEILYSTIDVWFDGAEVRPLDLRLRRSWVQLPASRFQFGQVIHTYTYRFIDLW